MTTWHCFCLVPIMYHGWSIWWICRTIVKWLILSFSVCREYIFSSNIWKLNMSCMISGTIPSTSWKNWEVFRIESQVTPYVVAIWLCNGPARPEQWEAWISRVRSTKSFSWNYRWSELKCVQIMYTFVCISAYKIDISWMPKWETCTPRLSLQQGCLLKWWLCSPDVRYFSIDLKWNTQVINKPETSSLLHVM